MSGDIFSFSLKVRPSRNQATRWLSRHFKSFPATNEIGDPIFHGWRFLKASDDIIYFTDFYHPEISEEELSEYRMLVSEGNE